MSTTVFREGQIVRLTPAAARRDPHFYHHEGEGGYIERRGEAIGHPTPMYLLHYVSCDSRRHWVYGSEIESGSAVQ